MSLNDILLTDFKEHSGGGCVDPRNRIFFRDYTIVEAVLALPRPVQRKLVRRVIAACVGDAYAYANRPYAKSPQTKVRRPVENWKFYKETIIETVMNVRI
jgi:hypothetical protein